MDKVYYRAGHNTPPKKDSEILINVLHPKNWCQSLLQLVNHQTAIVEDVKERQHSFNAYNGFGTTLLVRTNKTSEPKAVWIDLADVGYAQP